MMGRTPDTTRCVIAMSPTIYKAAPMAFYNQKACASGMSSAVCDLGTIGQMQQIIQREGIIGLWKGNLTRTMKVAPA